LLAPGVLENRLPAFSAASLSRPALRRVEKVKFFIELLISLGLSKTLNTFLRSGGDA
jgi:hypothetical protein